MATIRPNGVNRFFDDNGLPLAGGTVETFQSGTSTHLATYNDAAQTSPKTNPFQLDATGRATIYWQGVYKVVVRSADGSLSETIDPLDAAGDSVTAFAGSLASGGPGNGAALVAFRRTGVPSVARTLQTKLDDIWTAGDFGVVADGVTDDTAAINLALASGRIVQFPAGVMKVSATLITGNSGGIIGHGERTVFKRFFTGGPLIQQRDGTPQVLRDFAIDCDASITPVAGDDGIELGVVTPWAGRGDVNNLLIQRQWNGIRFKGGPYAGFYNINCFSNHGAGFVAINASGALYNCLSQFNGGDGYTLTTDISNAGNLQLIHCTSFYNSGFGLNAAGTPTINNANLWIDTFCSSYDLAGGIAAMYITQLKADSCFIEYAGATQNVASALRIVNVIANGILLSSGCTNCSITDTQVIGCQGTGVLLNATQATQVNGLLVYANGQGLNTNPSFRMGLLIQGGNTALQVSGLSAGVENSGQMYDLGIGTTDNAGIISGSVFGKLYETPQTLPGLVMSGINYPTLPHADAATTTTLPIVGDVIRVNATGNIANITASWPGRHVRLIYAGNVTISPGGNVKLAAGAFGAVSGSTQAFVCDGVNWYELSRANDT